MTRLLLPWMLSLVAWQVWFGLVGVAAYGGWSVRFLCSTRRAPSWEHAWGSAVSAVADRLLAIKTDEVADIEVTTRNGEHARFSVWRNQ